MSSIWRARRGAGARLTVALARSPRCSRSISGSSSLRPVCSRWRGNRRPCDGAARRGASRAASAGSSPCLQQEPTAPAFLLTLDPQSRTLTVRRVAATADAGRSYELWLISSKYPNPRSLGVVGGERIHRAADPGEFRCRYACGRRATRFRSSPPAARRAACRPGRSCSPASWWSPAGQPRAKSPKT